MRRNAFKVAAVLCSPVFRDREKTIQKLSDIVGDAAAQGARLVVFPETIVPYYPWWIWMGVNNPKKLELFRELYDNAVEVPGPDLEPLAKAAARHSIHVVVGVNERAGGTIYNTQVFFDDEGRLAGKRRKLMPTGEEKTVWGWGYGGDVKVLDTKLGKIGGLICYEHSMPLARFALYSMGEQIHVANWPGANFRSQPRDRSRIIDAAMRNTAFEGQVFVVFSSSRLSSEELEFYYELDPRNRELLAPGGGISGVVNPLGNYVAGPIEHEEGIAVGEIDLDLITAAKHMVDSTGHYARNDVFTLLLDGREQVPMAYRSGAPAEALPASDRWDQLRASIERLGNPELRRQAYEFEAEMRKSIADPANARSA